ncbi:MAG: Gmad2 immunoglobulin-like domain-containing protein [Candidatus Pacebacteria bacterium]|nr:Gmad2 immunoglobulin-like domain-containing protein [Candidatus Paceibacterota bacterium]MCF7863068.1 Gmad2 immunoglobulin-like domain-containing protein [Candidatus Paceibacterota bacterium]
MKNALYWVTFFAVIFLMFSAYLFKGKDTYLNSEFTAVNTSENSNTGNNSEIQKNTYTANVNNGLIYINSSPENIRVLLPFPGAVTGKDFKIIGQAKGVWFFEGSFPVKILDKDQKVLVETYASAEGEWMTEKFVPFTSDIKVPEYYIGPATLVLERNNASGLPEHDASLSFDFVIEY